MNFRKNVLPHLIAVVVFIVVTISFYHPLVFGGKILSQHDIVRGLGASQEIIEYREATGQEALWTNSMFGGMPAYLINMRWSGDLMLHVHRIITLWLPGPAAATLAACISFYLLLLVFKVRPWLAMIGGLAYGLGSFNIISIEAGHMWKVFAIAYMPMVLAGVHLTFSRKYLLGMGLTALALALELRSNHLQITYYLLLLLLIYGVVQLVFAIKGGEVQFLLKSVGYLIIAAVIALCCNLGKIWSVYEYGQYSTRGPSDLSSSNSQDSGLDRDYIFRWSNGIMEPVTLLIPEFFGGPTVSSLPADSQLGEALRNQGVPPVQIRQQLQQVYTYWGKQPSTAGPSYAGAIVIFLFVLGYYTLDKKTLIWISIATALSVVLSWGNNFESFNYFMYDYFPGYSKFRSVTMTMVIALLCIPLAAFMAVERVFSELNKPGTFKIVLKAFTVTGSLLLLAILYSYIGDFKAAIDERLSGQVPVWYLDALRADRSALLRSDAFRSLLLIVLVLGAIYLRSEKNKISMDLLIVILAVLVLFDLWNVNKRYLQSDDFIRESEQMEVAPSAANQTIETDTDPGYRVMTFLENPWAEGRTFYFHNSVGGYHGAKLRRYQELIEGCLDDQFRGTLQGLQNGQQDWSEFGVLNMLNTRYFLVGSEQNSVIKNQQAYGNAWLVSTVNIVNNADEELVQVCQITTSSTAVVDGGKFDISSNSFVNSGQIALEEYQPNYLRYQFNNPGNGFAVFSEIYYPKGWKATIDGAPVDILRVNFILRGLEIPSGSHTIEFRFEPAAYYTGNKIMMASSVLLLVLFLGIIGMELKQALAGQT